MSSAIDEAIEKAVQKATQDAIEDAVKKGASEAAQKAAGKAAGDIAREAAVKAASDAVAKGAATEAQKTLAQYAKDAGQALLKNPKAVAGGITAGLVAYHMYQTGETNPAQAIAEMVGEAANTGLGAFFGPFKNWILGGLGVIGLILVVVLLFKLLNKNNN